MHADATPRRTTQPDSRAPVASGLAPVAPSIARTVRTGPSPALETRAWRGQTAPWDPLPPRRRGGHRGLAPIAAPARAVLRRVIVLSARKRPLKCLIVNHIFVPAH
jgi:hypothetical protein